MWVSERLCDFDGYCSREIGIGDLGERGVTGWARGRGMDGRRDGDVPAERLYETVDSFKFGSG